MTILARHVLSGREHEQMILLVDFRFYSREAHGSI